MSLIPAFDIGLVNGWLFMAIYPLQWLVVLVIPKHVAERTGHPASLKQSRQARFLGNLNMLTWAIATLYSIFLPLQTGTPWFYAGLALAVIGVTIVITASFNVAATPTGRPFTGGAYRFSRHPMYLSMMFVYLGVSVASLSWLFLLFTAATFFLQRFQMLQEEGYCCAIFGDAYRRYMDRTPRWLGMPKSV